jgi:hypothetical protein
MRISDDVFSGSKKKHFNFFGCAPPPPLPPPHPPSARRHDLIQEGGHPRRVIVTHSQDTRVTQPRGVRGHPAEGHPDHMRHQRGWALFKHRTPSTI